jgi:hypothetical protein
MVRFPPDAVTETGDVVGEDEGVREGEGLTGVGEAMACEPVAEGLTAGVWETVGTTVAEGTAAPSAGGCEELATALHAITEEARPAAAASKASLDADIREPPLIMSASWAYLPASSGLVRQLDLFGVGYCG